MINEDCQLETHPFTPFIPDGAKILMLGTFPPSSNRWTMKFYYPNWINDMWRIMGLIFWDDKDYFCDSTNKKFYLPKIIDFLKSKHIALYDTGIAIRRLAGNASDKFLQIEENIDLDSMLNENSQIEFIVTTGEKAATVIRSITNTQLPKMGESTTFTFKERVITHFRMPSSSRAYPMKIEKKAEFYSKMFKQAGYSLFIDNIQ